MSNLSYGIRLEKFLLRVMFLSARKNGGTTAIAVFAPGHDAPVSPFSIDAITTGTTRSRQSSASITAFLLIAVLRRDVALPAVGAMAGGAVYFALRVLR